MENIDYLKAILALILIISLIIITAYIASKLGLGQKFGNKTIKGNRNLQIIETLMLDTSRRLVVIKYHEQEHLILTSKHGDTIIDSKKNNIVTKNE